MHQIVSLQKSNHSSQAWSDAPAKIHINVSVDVCREGCYGRSQRPPEELTHTPHISQQCVKQTCVSGRMIETEKKKHAAGPVHIFQNATRTSQNGLFAFTRLNQPSPLPCCALSFLYLSVSVSPCTLVCQVLSNSRMPVV